jgi:hypothetical protein
MFCVLKCKDTHTHNPQKGSSSPKRLTNKPDWLSGLKAKLVPTTTLQTECCLVRHDIFQAAEKESTYNNMPVMDITSVSYT